MIGFLVQGRVRIKIRIRVRVGIWVMFNVSIYKYHRSNCRQSKCHTFKIRVVGGSIRSLRMYECTNLKVSPARSYE